MCKKPGGARTGRIRRQDGTYRARGLALHDVGHPLGLGLTSGSLRTFLTPSFGTSSDRCKGFSIIRALLRIP